MFSQNLVCQKLKADLPNVLWVSDVTFIRDGDVFYSPCVIIDVFFRKVIAHKISLNNDTALVLAIFQEAFAVRGNPSRITFQSDQGKNYTVYAFRYCLREHGIHQSFSNPTTPHNNAIAEAFFSALKREDISHSYYKDQQELENAVANYIDFTTPCILIANGIICLQMILNTILGLMEYKSPVQMFNNPVTLGREQKKRFSASFEKTPTILSCDGVFTLLQLENKNRNFSGIERPVQDSVYTAFKKSFYLDFWFENLNIKCYLLENS